MLCLIFNFVASGGFYGILKSHLDFEDGNQEWWFSPVPLTQD